MSEVAVKTISEDTKDKRDFLEEAGNFFSYKYFKKGKLWFIYILYFVHIVGVHIYTHTLDESHKGSAIF